MDTTSARDVARWWMGRALLIVVFGLLLFACAGRLDWDAGLRIVALGALGLVAEGLVLPRALKADRARVQPGSKSWDAGFVRIAAIGLYLALFVVAGLSARWHVLSELPAWLVHSALALWALGYALGLYAMRQNRFFSRTVRIQPEHRVIDRGPYAWVRHPGYVSSLAFLVTTPLLLEAPLALVPAALAAALLVFRSAAEDRTLHRELAGYSEYARRVRFRLLPGVW